MLDNSLFLQFLYGFKSRLSHQSRASTRDSRAGLFLFRSEILAIESYLFCYLLTIAETALLCCLCFLYTIYGDLNPRGFRRFGNVPVAHFQPKARGGHCGASRSRRSGQYARRQPPQTVKSRLSHQNENPFSKEGGFLFCIIHFSLFTIHPSLNRIFVMKDE